VLAGEGADEDDEEEDGDTAEAATDDDADADDDRAAAGDVLSVAQWLEARLGAATFARVAPLAAAGYANTMGAPLANLSVRGARVLERRWASDDGDRDFRVWPVTCAVFTP
jgi:hypothetical protein